MNSPLSIVHFPDNDEDTVAQNEIAAGPTKPSQAIALPVAEPVDVMPQPYTKTEGQLVIDHKVEGIANATCDMDIPKETPTLHFTGGLHHSGEFTAGSIDVYGTLVISEGANVNVQKLKCKRLYINRGEINCVSIETESLIAWDGAINASHEIAYRALEESRFCAINGNMRWIGG